jgi:small-conductance mechanosensitive channel
MSAMRASIAPISDVTDWARSDGLLIVLFLTGAVLFARFVRWFGVGVTRRIDVENVRGDGLVPTEAAKHGHVLAQVTTWAVIVLGYCTAAVLVLQRMNVPVTGLVAPAAVVGVALGFGAQRIVQDVLAGLFIIGERQYGFGDVVRVSPLGSETGVTGTVEEVTLRITRLRSFSGDVVTVPNGQIVQVTNLSRDWARAVVDVPVPSTADVHGVSQILEEVGRRAAEDETLGPLLLDTPTVLGVQSIEVDILHLRMVARTLPGKQFEVGRELRARVAMALQAKGLTVSADLSTANPTRSG